MSSAAVGRTTVVAIITTIANAVTLPSLKSRRRRDLRVAHSMFWSDDYRLLFRRQSTSRENTFPPTNEFWKSRIQNPMSGVPVGFVFGDGFQRLFGKKTKTRWSWWVWRSTGQETRWQKTQQTIPSDTLMLIRSVDKPTNQFGENRRRAKTQAENKKKKKPRRSKMIRKVIEKITTRPSISLFRSCP